jgi:SAM-dependent methyltransferase
MSRFKSRTVARQFGAPRGTAGRLVGHLMARGNRGFNAWVVNQLGERERSPESEMRIVELGPGPGVGLEEALLVFPTASFWGIDPSREMLAQCRKRNLEQVTDGRLVLLQGGTDLLAGLAPVDLVMAVHVLYFWHQPELELARIRDVLRPGGALGLGYRLRQHMPHISQTGFPKEGHRLYESDAEVDELLSDAGFGSVERRLVDSRPDAPAGRLAIATA